MEESNLDRRGLSTFPRSMAKYIKQEQAAGELWMREVGWWRRVASRGPEGVGGCYVFYRRAWLFVVCCLSLNCLEHHFHEVLLIETVHLTSSWLGVVCAGVM
jgi:hypothetical protein